MSQLPPGFVLDGGSNSGPPMPADFVMDAPLSKIDHLKAAVTDIPGEIAGAFKSAVSTIGDNLNPFSQSRMDSIERQSKAPSMIAALGESISQTLGVGKGLAAIPETALSPITGTARSAIGHPYSALTGMPYEQAKDVVDTAMMGIKPIGATPKGIVSKSAPSPSAAEIKTSGSKGYQSPEVTNLELNPQPIAVLSQKIESDLLTKGHRPGNSKGVFDEVQALTPQQGVQSVRIADLESARRALGEYAGEVNAVGKPTSQAKAAKTAQNHIDDYLDAINPRDVIAGDPVAGIARLKQARADYAAGSKAEEIDFRLSKAERQAAKSGSGSNIENARRQKMDQVPERGLTAQEKALRDQIVLGTPARNTLRKVGKLGVDGGLSLMLHSAAGIGSGGMTIPVTVAGTIARKIGEALTARQIRQLNEMIRARSPLSQSMPPLQASTPSPLLGAAVPYQFSQGLPIFRGAVPAYADQDEPRRR